MQSFVHQKFVSQHSSSELCKYPSPIQFGCFPSLVHFEPFIQSGYQGQELSLFVEVCVVSVDCNATEYAVLHAHDTPSTHAISLSSHRWPAGQEVKLVGTPSSHI